MIYCNYEKFFEIYCVTFLFDIFRKRRKQKHERNWFDLIEESLETTKTQRNCKIMSCLLVSYPTIKYTICLPMTNAVIMKII